ncbi:MAG: ABC transporter permease [Clostridiales bacterium]|nr:ABC transporter permease [Clostridiales bacterium]
MLKYLLHKAFLTIGVLLGVALCSFFLLRALPGDPAQALAGPQATQADVETVRHALRLDEPLHTQCFTYIGNLLKGDLGYSYRTRRPVTEEIASRWPNTLRLSLFSMAIAVSLGVPLGIFAARRHGTLLDPLSMAGAFLGVSMPSVWLGMLLILLFSVRLKWFPFYGMSTLSHYVLPGLTLGLSVAANIARLTRVSVLEVLGADYVRTARGKGAGELRVVYVHSLRNAAIPIVTIIGLQLGALLGGQVVTETLFSWPGIGRMIVDSLNARDYMVAQGGILILALTFTVINLLTDLLYTILDPRVRLG